MSEPEAHPAARHLDRNVWVAGLVSLFTDISSEMIVPVLPLYLTGVLGAPAMVVGLIEGVAETTASLTKSVSGWLSDQVGRRKPLMVFGYGLSNLIKPLLGLTTGAGQVLAIRFADRFSKGVRGAPRDALIADSTPPDLRGRAFGLHRALDTVGAAIGPLLAALLLVLYADNFRAVFWWTAVPGVISVLLLLAFLHDTGAPAAPRGVPRRQGWSLSLRPLAPRLRWFVLISTLFALGNSADAFLVLRARGLGLAAGMVPLAYFLFNTTYALLSYPAGALSDRIGRRPVIIAGFLTFALIYAGFGAATQPWQVWGLFALYGLYYAGTEGIAKAYLTDHVPAERRGSAIGVFNAYTGLAALPASWLAGLLWDRWGPPATFFCSAAIALLAAGLLALPLAPGGEARAA